jgi:hypothetical protein
MIRRTLPRLDAEAIGARLSITIAPAAAGVRSRSTAKPCTAPETPGPPGHLLAVMNHATHAMLAQRQVDGARLGARLSAAAGRPGTSLGWWRRTRYRPTARPPSSSRPFSRRTTCSRQGQPARAAGPPRPLASGACAGPAPATAGTDGSSCRASRRSRSPGFTFPHAAQVIEVTRKVRDLGTPAMVDRERIRDHQPHLPAGQPRAARRLHPWALSYR